MKTRKLIAMIPARLGSKRIPRKNIRYLGDKPLIQYPVDLALSSNRFESIWLNSENDDLGHFAKKLGAKFHKRPDYLASDTATNKEFVYEFLQNHDCDYVVMVNSTSPLIRKKTLEDFTDYIDQNDFDTVLSVVTERAESFFCGEPINFSLTEKINSQFLEPVEHIIWSLTAWKRSKYIELQNQGVNPVFGGRLGRFAIPKDEACDLDTEEDWRIAEGMLQSRIDTGCVKRYWENPCTNADPT